MEVILLQDVANLGEKNDLVTVKPGYGRNFLIPRGLAMIANDSNRKIFEDRQRHEQARIDALASQYGEIKDKLENTKVTLGAKVGETDKIFGSVTNIQVADAIKDQHGIEINRKVININEDIKALGEYTATIALGADMSFDINLEVVAE